jgi:2-oxoglutarate dehydrogenase E1 component
MHDSVMEQQRRESHFSGGNFAYIEEMYETYLRDPNAVPEQWRQEFDQLSRVPNSIGGDVPHSTIKEHFVLLGKNQSKSHPIHTSTLSSDHERKQVSVVRLINAYRVHGHQIASLDPLNLKPKEIVQTLDLHFHELSAADLDTVFQLGASYLGKEEMPLSEIIKGLEETYCSTVGCEYSHIVNTDEKLWIRQRVESVRSHPQHTPEKRLHIFERLIAAEGLEKYLASRFSGAKRFGLEGGEALIPMLDNIIQRSGSNKAKEIVIGMAHRGRLNVLINIFGKNPVDLFEEFEGKQPLNTSGDVKYHQGFSTNVNTPGGEVHMAMAFNPSHLEIANPVVEGSVRARQDRRNDTEGDTVLPICLHGDAAFAGQGVVMETLQMSQTRAYKTGGTVHIVINNQVGFTTSKKEDARTTPYCTDVAKFIDAPIFHVNGDDPDAVAFVSELALDYRNEFKRDVVIDLVCYRRRGHNEADEPSGTQPLMYNAIKAQKTVTTIYGQQLMDEGVLTSADITSYQNDYRNALDNGEHVAKALVTIPDSSSFVDWKPYLGHEWTAAGDTRVSGNVLKDLGQRLDQVPQGFVVQRQVKKILDDRLKMASGAAEINWGFAEVMAYASLLEEGYPIRLTGQDVGRGTFSHRHAVLHDQKGSGAYVPLRNLSPKQPEFTIFDSLLSEEAVLAFEYGYASTSPEGLVIWEAQFGDFANGAQVVIDQFITSGEHKWGRMCGLTMLLPHGYEGQGPEHSSARLERYLQLCAEHNIQVCVPTTPSQIFHLIRRQAIRPMRKPLVVMTPKSLLRHKMAVSNLDELAKGEFLTVIDDVDDHNKDAVKRMVLTSGKVYYDLLEQRRLGQLNHVAIVRIEQLYPFPERHLADVLSQYPNLEIVVWCQEEPQNQGAWYCSQHHMRKVIQIGRPKLDLIVASRLASAAPACGYMSVHLEEQRHLVAQALGLES